MRRLLRAFLSPAVADRYASALQPIAVADRDAALAGAVSTLRARFFVLPEELAVVLVKDAGWSVADVSTMLGLPTIEVRAAVRTAAEAAPRVGATPPGDLDDVDDEAAAVEARLADLPTDRGRASAAADAPATGEPADVELSSSPTRAGLPPSHDRVRRADRLPLLVVSSTTLAVLTVLTVLALVAVAFVATRPGEEQALPTDDRVAIEPTPTTTTTPTTPTPPTPATPATPATTTGPASSDEVPVGPPALEAARFVASVDPATGEPGRRLDPATTTDDPRLWLRFGQLPAQDLLLNLTFTAPSGQSTVRPVLVGDRTPLVSVRLPDELGREPGRYAVRIEADGMDPEVVELEVVAPREE